MSTDTIPESHDLANKPLVEALFELRWKLDENPTRGTTAFRLLFGRYYERIRASYPEAEDLPSSAVPEIMTPYVVRHRFRASKEKWPVTQLGPGIMTVNETENYKWESFRQQIEATSRAVFEGYPAEFSTFEPAQAELRYINMIPYDFEDGGITEFIEKNLHTTIRMDERLFNGPPKTGNERGLEFSLSYRLTKPKPPARFRLPPGKVQIRGVFCGRSSSALPRSSPRHAREDHELVRSGSRGS